MTGGASSAEIAARRSLTWVATSLTAPRRPSAMQCQPRWARYPAKRRQTVARSHRPCTSTNGAVNLSVSGRVTSASSGPKRVILCAYKAKRPSGIPEGLCVSRSSCLCEKEKLGPREWPQSVRDSYLLLLLRSCFLLRWGLLLRSRSALLLHRHVCLLAEIGC